MVTRLQNTVNFHAYYQLAAAYGGRKYHEARNWIIQQSKQAYLTWPTVRTLFWSRATTSAAMGMSFVSRNFQAVNVQLPILATFFKNKVGASYAIGRAFAGKHISAIIGCGAAGVALSALIYYWKNRPEYPGVKLASSLNFAVLHIATPKAHYKPKNLSLTFCIDVSGSMDSSDRLGAVQNGLVEILDHAQGVINNSKESKIGLGIVQFNDKATVVAPFTSLTPIGNQAPENTTAGQLKTQVASLKTSGRTQILAGLEKATEELEKAARTNPQSSQVLILLTDGKDSIGDKELAKIHQRLTSVSAKLFAIGIGQSHKKDTLENIAGSKSKTFKGTYIDTTQQGVTIQGSISSIYHQAISHFKEMTLTCSQLLPGTWSISNATLNNDKGQYVYNLGSQSEGTTVNRGIWIDWKKINSSVELSDVSFTLTFTDPQGRKGTLLLPWNPNTIIDPEIIKTVPPKSTPSI